MRILRVTRKFVRVNPRNRRSSETSPERSPTTQVSTAAISPTTSSVTSSQSTSQQQTTKRVSTSTNPATIYLRKLGGNENVRSVIIQQVMPDGSVQIRPLSGTQPTPTTGVKTVSREGTPKAVVIVPAEDFVSSSPAIDSKRKREEASRSSSGSSKADSASEEISLRVTSLPEFTAGTTQATGTGLYTLTAAGSDYDREIFGYEVSESQELLPDQPNSPVTEVGLPSPSASMSPTSGDGSSDTRKYSWCSYLSEPEGDKVVIPKSFSDVGFQYCLETQTSPSQRKDDDRMTYINKGQFYDLTLEYIPDPDRPLRSSTVKSLVMVVFREERDPDDDLKSWKFWLSKQHSVKQRILDVDKKNCSGVVGQIEKLTHNAIAFCWNPLESPARVSIAVNCLSTDFNNQKGVKGLPLHIQVDTTDDLGENAERVHRGYCQIKVFRDKGAERKVKVEERRAIKMKLNATLNRRKRLEEMYPPKCDRSEFYSMSDLTKPPVLFLPQNDHHPSVEGGLGLDCYKVNNNPDLTSYAITIVPVESSSIGEDLDQQVEVLPAVPAKKLKSCSCDRVILYAKRPDEEVFHALHLVPPSMTGLVQALEEKYGLAADMIRHLYKKCKKGITVEMDDDIIRHYCNEDVFQLDITETETGQFDVVLVEL